MNKAEKAKAYREELKAEGYCPRCYKRKAVAGKLHCKECEKYYYAYYHAHKAQRLEYAKQRREKLKAAGLCTQCGKRQQEKGIRHIINRGDQHTDDRGYCQPWDQPGNGLFRHHPVPFLLGHCSAHRFSSTSGGSFLITAIK